MAVLAASKAAADARRAGQPRPNSGFECFVCRGVCNCNACQKKTTTKAAGKPDASKVNSPPCPRVARTPVLSKSKEASPSRSDAATKCRAAAAALLSPTDGEDSTPPAGGAASASNEAVATPVPNKEVAAAAPTEAAAVSVRGTPAALTPEETNGKSATTDKGSATVVGAKAAADPQRPGKKARSNGKPSTPPLAPSKADDPPCDSSQAVVLSPEDASLFPWMSPECSAPSPSPPERTGNEVNGVVGSACGSPWNPSSSSQQQQQQVRLGDHSGVQVAAEAQQAARGMPKAYSGGVKESVTGLGNSVAGSWHSPTKKPQASSSVRARPRVSVSVATATTTTTSSAAVSVGAGSGTYVNRGRSALYSSATLLSTSASVVTVAAARKAEVLRKRAADAHEAAQKLREAVLDAKSFSDRNNKAAMWRVEAATKLKDKLVMANELINGYNRLRSNAEKEARAAAAEEATAVARLRDAEAEASGLHGPRAATATAAPAWKTNPTMSSAFSSASCSAAGVMSAAAAAATTTPGGSNAMADGRASPGGVPAVVNGGGEASSNPTCSTDRVAMPQGAFPLQPGSRWWLSGEQSTQQRHSTLSAPTIAALIVANGVSGHPAGVSFQQQQQGAAIGCQASTSPTGLLTAMKMKSSPAMAGGVNPVVEARRRDAVTATAAARDKEATVVELAKRQKRAEAGRAELVRETQWASDAASKASAAAMHYEQVARSKRAEEKLAVEYAGRTEWEAQKAEWDVSVLADAERANAFAGGAAGGGGSGGGDGDRRGGEVNWSASTAPPNNVSLLLYVFGIVRQPRVVWLLFRWSGFA